MAKTGGEMIRVVALWIMILCAIAATALLWWMHQTVWAVFWTAIIVLVIGFEIYGLLTKRKTISTMYKDFIIKKPVIAYSVLVLLGIALNALILHLAVW